MKIKKTIISFVIAMLIIFPVLFLVYKYYFSKNLQNNNETAAKITTPEGQVLAETEETYQNEFKSDKYRVPQLGFGGGLTTFYPGLGEPLGPLDISSVQSQVVRTKDKNDLQLAINWRTERPTVCRIDWGKSGGTTKSVQEEFFAIEHSAVLEKLDSASTYQYTITAKDKLGGEVSSEKYAVYTGAPEVSFFDLLAGAFKSAFSWAVK
jgi:hypothetical protein